jgi:hypothetical protein
MQTLLLLLLLFEKIFPETIQPREPRCRRLQRHRGRVRRSVAAQVLLHRQPRQMHKTAKVSISRIVVRNVVRSIIQYDKRDH